MMPPLLNLRASAQLTRRFQIVSERDGGHARAGKRPVSEYGPGARRGQPGEVLGLPDQRMLPARSETASELSPLSSLLTF